MSGIEPVYSWIAFLILILAALGTFLPVIPGLPMMAVVVIGYGWLEDFTRIDIYMIVLTLIFTVFGSAVDYLAGPYMARRVGATKSGVWGAVLGGIAGIIFLGPLGLILGPFLGAAAGEIIGGQGLRKASKIGVASMAGIISGNLAKFIMAIIIVVMFFWRVLK